MKAKIVPIFMVLVALSMLAVGQATIDDWFIKGIDAINADNSTKLSNDWWGKGEELYGQGKYDDAVQAYNMAIELNPNDAIALASRDAALAKAEETRSSNGSRTWGRQDPNNAAFKRNENLIVRPQRSFSIFDLFEESINDHSEMMFQPVENYSNRKKYSAYAKGVAVKGEVEATFWAEKPIYFAGGWDPESIPAPDGSTNRSFIILDSNDSAIGVIHVNSYPDPLPDSYNASNTVVETFYLDVHRSSNFHSHVKLVTMPKNKKPCAIGFGWVPAREYTVFVANYQHDFNTTVTIIILRDENQQLFNDIVSTFELLLFTERDVENRRFVGVRDSSHAAPGASPPLAPIGGENIIENNEGSPPEMPV